MAFEISIRSLRKGDIAQLEAMERRFFPTPYTAWTWMRERRNSLSRTFVAFPGGDAGMADLVGYINFWIVVDEAQLHRLAVDEGFRRRGVAMELIRHMLRYLAERAVATVQLEVRQRNIHAVRLYERMGFAMQGRRRGYYEETGEDALLLTGVVNDILNARNGESRR
ncbi:MAG: ribosomal protein S18-alanine N-acetyltransferase [Pseudomonadota bacterium]|nr:ribosomal protein S18-alanine N-acetyltransferase [Pseudomonadota bacterium]